MSTIEERLNGAGAAPWIPNPENAKKWLEGGTDRMCYSENPVIGTAVDHFSRDTDFGTYDVLVLNVEGHGDVAVHCRGAVLTNEMHAARPRYGERVGVKLTGEGEGSKGKYPIYKVVVERERGGEFGWSDQPQAREELPSRQVNEEPVQQQGYQSPQYGAQQPPQQQQQAPSPPVSTPFDDDIPF